MKKILIKVMLVSIVLLVSCEATETPTLSIDYDKEVYFSPLAAEEENVFIKVNTSQPNWDVISSEDWCCVTKNNEGFLVGAKPYTSLYYMRVANITISAPNAKSVIIRVFQDPVMFSVNAETEYLFGEEGGSFDIDVWCNTEWSITADKDWVTYTPNCGTATKCGTVHITVDANHQPMSDSAILRISAGEAETTVKIYREAVKRRYQIGDLYPDTQNPIGIVFSILNEGKNGKIFSLYKEFYHQWSSEHYRVHAISPTDGQFNMQQVEKRLQTPTSHVYPAFSLCKELGDGWYFPASEEMLDIYKWWNGGPGEANQQAREKNNQLIEQYKGVPLNTVYTSTYLTSTEYTSDTCIYISFYKGSDRTEEKMLTFSKHALGGCIRPIYAF